MLLTDLLPALISAFGVGFASGFIFGSVQRIFRVISHE